MSTFHMPKRGNKLDIVIYKEINEPGRVETMEGISRTLRQKIPASIWALMWLSDLLKLKELASACKSHPFVWLTAFDSWAK